MELVDVVTADDEVIDTVTRSAVRAENLRHRAVYVLVQSTSGEVLIHRRSESKDLWPGAWDVAVGGVVLAGEGYDAAARRELGEELGLDDVQPEPLGRDAYEDDDVRLLGAIYRLVHDGPFRFLDGEVIEARFVGRPELEARLARDAWVPDSLALALPWLSWGVAPVA